MANEVKWIRKGRAQFQGIFDNIFLVKVTIDLPSISSNGSYTEIVAVPGVTTYDMVLGVSSNADNEGLSRLVHVNSNNSLHFEVHNGTGGPVDLPECIFYVVIGSPIIDI